MSIEYKVGVDARVPVRLLNASNVGIAGVGFGSVTATVAKADGSFATVSPADGAHWIEETTGAFSATGTYTLVIPAANINITGVLIYAVAVSGANPFINYAKVVPYEEADTYAAVLRCLGLLHENHVLDLTTYDINNHLLSGRVRIYSTAADAVAAQAASPSPYTTNMVAAYSITATYAGMNLTTYLVQRTA